MNRRREKVITVKYVVKDCPVTGKVVETHYISHDKSKKIKK